MFWMNELLNDFEELSNQLNDALIRMDAGGVSSLSILQTSCLEEIQRKVTSNPEYNEIVTKRLIQLRPLKETHTIETSQRDSYN